MAVVFLMSFHGKSGPASERGAYMQVVVARKRHSMRLIKDVGNRSSSSLHYNDVQDSMVTPGEIVSCLRLAFSCKDKQIGLEACVELLPIRFEIPKNGRWLVW